MYQTVRLKARERLAQLEKYRLSDLDPSVLDALIKNIDKEYLKVADLARESIIRVQTDLESADINALSKAKKQVAKFKARLEALDEQRCLYSNERQKKIIQLRMEQKLGSPKARVALDGLVMVLVVVVLGLLFYDFTAGSDESRPVLLYAGNIFIIDTVCCFIFLGEFFFRLICAEDKKYVWRKHWLDFATSIPIPGEAQLARFGRVARVARIARALRILRFLRVFLLLWRGMDKFQEAFDVKLMKKTIKWSVIATIMGASLIFFFEGSGEMVDPNGNPVDSMPEAIWWSFTTVLTGGFGDIHNPQTYEGQVLTGLLVVMGMILVGVFTATLTTLFVGEQSEDLQMISEEIKNKLNEISESAKLD